MFLHAGQIGSLSGFQVQDELYLYTKNGRRIKRLAEDSVGTISVSAKLEDTWFFATTSGFLSPGITYLYNFSGTPEISTTEGWSILRSTRLNGLDPSEFKAEQVGFSLSARSSSLT
jgi:prolyl oligopeptidase